jgi:hypothetical protein
MKAIEIVKQDPRSEAIKLECPLAVPNQAHSMHLKFHPSTS